MVVAHLFGGGFGGFGGEAHEERQRDEAEDDPGEESEGVFVAEHRGLAQHLLIGIADGGLGGLRSGHALLLQSGCSCADVLVVTVAGCTAVRDELLLVGLGGAGEEGGEQGGAESSGDGGAAEQKDVGRYERGGVVAGRCCVETRAGQTERGCVDRVKGPCPSKQSVPSARLVPFSVALCRKSSQKRKRRFGDRSTSFFFGYSLAGVPGVENSVKTSSERDFRSRGASSVCFMESGSDSGSPR